MTDEKEQVKQVWHCPSMGRIDIKQTMDGSGVLVDFDNNAAANTLPPP